MNNAAHLLEDKKTMSFNPNPAGTIRRIDVTDLQALLEHATQAGATLALIDVREPHEFAGGHLTGAINIPLGQLPQRFNEITQADPVFICRSGGRSFAACQFALQAGSTSPANLEGGMLAWDAQAAGE
jgi:rhodanese-related sulfurtransferase